MDTLSGDATLPILLKLFFSVGVNSERKEFAPAGENSFFLRAVSILERFYLSGM